MESPLNVKIVALGDGAFHFFLGRFFHSFTVKKPCFGHVRIILYEMADHVPVTFWAWETRKLISANY